MWEGGDDTGVKVTVGIRIRKTAVTEVVSGGVLLFVALILQ